MKKPIILLSAVTIITAASYFLISQKSFSTATEQKEHKENEEAEEGEEDEQQSGAGKQLNGWFQAKAYPNPSNLTAKYLNAWEQYLEIKAKTTIASRTEAANWTSLGYCQNGGTRIGGRIVCMAIDPNNTNNLWVGSASGGIWKSTNAGTNWSAVVTNLPVLGVSSILVDPSNSNIIYAGTGEVYNTDITDAGGFNVWKTRGTYGIGVIKSTDGGATWAKVFKKNEADLFGIQSMAFLPGTSTTIFACSTDGVYRSVDSGATWDLIYSGANVRDIAINPGNTNQMVISVGNMMNATKGIYRTINGSNVTPTWTKITSGLPASYEGHIKLDNSGAGVLVASIGVSSGSSNEVYKSTDFGASWSVISTSNHCSYQFWFAHTIAVNPFFTDSLVYGGVSLYRHNTATSSRGTVAGPHADQHDIKFDPVRRGTLYVCNDGGVYKSTNGGVNFSAINTGLNATQFYASLGVSRQNANVMIGGLQDNGQVLYNGTSWNAISWGGGDGTSCAIHPTNDQIILASRDARQIYRSANGGSSGGAVTTYWGFVGDSRTAFVAPIAFAPSNGNVAYQASDNIHISANAGSTFTNNTLGSTPPYPATTPNAFIEQRHKTAIALAVSWTNSSKLYVTTSPFAQYDNDVSNIYVNGTPNIFKTTTPATTPYTSIKSTLPDRFITDMAISKYSDDSVYIVLGGFGGSHVYLTANGGTSWTSVGAGLPDVPFNAIIIDPVNPKTIYAGCDFGVYVSTDRGATWIDYNNGFYDATLIMDLQIDANNKLIAATHGKGVFRSDLYVASTLPVTLLDFNGKGYSGYNQLKWTVSQEQNLDRYELERGTDGAVFTKVSSTPARNEVNQTTYSYNDQTSLFESYYRLKIINTDGSFTYSSIVFIRKNGGKNEFIVLGNPFTDNLIFQYKIAQAQKLNIRLFNAAGSLMRREEYAATAGTGTYTIAGLNNLTPGIYALKIETANDKQVIRVLKK